MSGLTCGQKEEWVGKVRAVSLKIFSLFQIVPQTLNCKFALLK